MGGSKKGERRGAAGRARRRSSHETVSEIMDDVSRRRLKREKTERRLEIARIINGGPGAAFDMSMKEIMIDNARYHHQAALDWERFVQHHASISPPTAESTQAVLLGEQKVDYHRSQSTDHAFKAAPYVHPKLAAAVVATDPGANAKTILSELLDDIDDRMREGSGMLIEHDPIKKTG